MSGEPLTEGNFTATIPVAQMAEVNDILGDEGFGYSNFSVPIGDADSVTHAALHCWKLPALSNRLEELQADFPDLTITYGTGEPNFTATLAEHNLERWTQPEGAHDAVMKGDIVEAEGKTWESLIDYNVWPPGVSGWREVVSEGYAAWVQPTGAHDAYGIGDRVMHNGITWQSTHDANTWEPSVFGWDEIDDT